MNIDEARARRMRAVATIAELLAHRDAIVAQAQRFKGPERLAFVAMLMATLAGCYCLFAFAESGRDFDALLSALNFSTLVLVVWRVIKVRWSMMSAAIDTEHALARCHAILHDIDQLIAEMQKGSE